jgi:hypothetical protein
MENRTESCCFWDHFIIHCLLEIVRNRVPKKVKRTESCFIEPTDGKYNDIKNFAKKNHIHTYMKRNTTHQMFSC